MDLRQRARKEIVEMAQWVLKSAEEENDKDLLKAFYKMNNAMEAYIVQGKMTPGRFNALLRNEVELEQGPPLSMEKIPPVAATIVHDDHEILSDEDSDSD